MNAGLSADAERCFCRLTPTWRPNQGRSSISGEDVNTSWQATRGSCGQHQVPRPVCVIINRCGHIERGQVHKCPFHSGGGGGLARRRVGTPEGRGPPPLFERTRLLGFLLLIFETWKGFCLVVQPETWALTWWGRFVLTAAAPVTTGLWRHF